MTTKKTPTPKYSTSKIFFQALFLESLVAFLVLALQPSDLEGRDFLLYSAPRFLELIIAAFIAGLSAWGIKKTSDLSSAQKLEELLTRTLGNTNIIFGGITIFLLSRLSLVILQVFAEGIDLHYLAGYATQLKPLFFLFSLIGYQIILWTLFANKKYLLHLARKKKSLIITGNLWGLISILSALSIFFEEIRGVIQRDATRYSPLLEWYIFLIWVLLTIKTIILLQEQKVIITENSSLIQSTLFIAILLSIVGVTFQFSLQSTMRLYTKDQFYFQKWSSEDIMQTVSLEDLQKHPLETLNNIHIKPPGFDAIRAVLVHLWPSPYITTSLLHVDFLLYKLWTFLYGLLGAIIFLWLYNLTNIKLASISSLVFFLHPANILYTTVLDSTFLTTFLVSIYYYVLWKTNRKHETPVFWLILATLALFFTRAIFQIPFLIVTLLALLLFKIKKQKILFFFTHHWKRIWSIHTKTVF